ncbi:MAG: hypothetical protein EKK46_06450 [Rhodocyclaceae bacterium]|nr:MAG: hypothetical protein EKK46_06450 [Rhodocyclaceae bacterium]
MKGILIATSLQILASTTALAQAGGEPAPVHTVTGNAALVSDYRFRGISQSWELPAVQGGIDYSHASGFYLGNWNSSVSGNSYNNGASLEMDFYGGYKFDLAQDLQGDVGVLRYYYPGAKLNSAPGVATSDKYDNTEIYAALNYGNFSGKISYALTDYFGLNGTTAAYAYWTSLTDRGDSKGSTYLDLNYSVDLGDKLSLGLHLGHASVHNYGVLSYTDYKIGLSKEIAGVSLGAALIGTDANKTYYQIGDASWSHPKKVGADTVVLSVSKVFQ